MKRFGWIALLGLLATAQAGAQIRVESIGGQVGSPTAAVSLRGTVQGVQAAAEVGFSFEDDFVDVAAFGLSTGALEDSPLRYYVGPGATVGLRSDAVQVGALVAAGLLFQTGRFEVFLQAAPVLYVLPETRGDLRAAVGLRYLLGS
jgi:hypothetical protein